MFGGVLLRRRRALLQDGMSLLLVRRELVGLRGCPAIDLVGGAGPSASSLENCTQDSTTATTTATATSTIRNSHKNRRRRYVSTAAQQSLLYWSAAARHQHLQESTGGAVSSGRRYVSSSSSSSTRFNRGASPLPQHPQAPHPPPVTRRRRRRRRRRAPGAGGTSEGRQALARAQHVLDERAYPLGVWTESEFRTAHALLTWFRDRTVPSLSYPRNDNNDNDDDWEWTLRSVDVALKLWLRSLDELAVPQKPLSFQSEFWQWTQPSFYSPLLNHWKEALRSAVTAMGRNSSFSQMWITPPELWDKLQMYHNDTLAGRFTYNIVIWNILLHALVAHYPPHTAPEHAEALLEWIEQPPQNCPNAPHRPRLLRALQPTVCTYNPILAAWVHSGRRPREVWPRVERLWQRLRDTGVTPNEVSYRRRWRAMASVLTEQPQQQPHSHSTSTSTAGKNSDPCTNDSIAKAEPVVLLVAQQVDTILQEMVQHDHLQPDVGCWFHVVMAYTAARQWKRAHQVLEEQFFHPNDDNKRNQGSSSLVIRDRGTITEAALRILQGYRSFYAFTTTTSTPRHVALAEKRHVLIRAERLVEDLLQTWIVDNEESEFQHPRHVNRLERSRIATVRLRERVLSLWLDLLALAGRADEVEALLEHGYPSNNTRNKDGTVTAAVVTKVPWDAVKLGILFKAYGRTGTPERASERLRHLVDHPPPFPLQVSVFNSAIAAWAEASSFVRQQPHSDNDAAVEQVVAILDLLGATPGLQPDGHTFCCFLKCLSRSNAHDAGARAEQVLDAMDQAAADDLGGRSSSMNVRPNVICYNLALRTCCNAGDLERAQRIMERMERAGSPPNVRTYQEILMYYASIGTLAAAERCEAILEHMMKSTTKNRKPDSICYNITLGAWVRTMDNNPDATDRMWKLYQRMQAHGIERELPLYRNLLVALTKKKDSARDLDRAEEVLASMECCDSTSTPMQQSDRRLFTQTTRNIIQQARNSLRDSVGDEAAVGETSSSSDRRNSLDEKQL